MATRAPKPIAVTQQANLPATGFIRLAQLVLLIPLGKSSIWRKVKEKRFPKPIKLSENVTAWRCEDIRAWMDAQASGE